MMLEESFGQGIIILYEYVPSEIIYLGIVIGTSKVLRGLDVIFFLLA